MKYYHVSRIKNFFDVDNKIMSFYADPYIQEFKNDTECPFESGEHFRKNQNDFDEHLDFLLSKENEYLDVIYARLNALHSTQYSKFFWDKSIKIFFRRYLCSVYDAFLMHEKYFDEKKFQFKVLNEKNYIRPKSFTEQRNLFEQLEIGLEQLFSQYIKCFYPSLYVENRNVFNRNKDYTPCNLSKRLSLKGTIKKLFIKLIQLRKPKVLLYEAFFSGKSILLLMLKSFGQIQLVTMDMSPKEVIFDMGKREKLFATQLDHSKFSKYLFFTLKYNFPSMFIESFIDQTTKYSYILNNYRDVKYIVSESWIGNDTTAFFLAYSKEIYQIKHIYNEHNCLFHMVKGSNTTLEVELCDIFYTLGWGSKKNENIVKGASLFPFSMKKRIKQKNQILYISGFPSVKRAQIHGAYSQDQENAKVFLQYIQKFFKKLEASILNKVVYRDYPSNLNWFSYDKTKYIQEFIPLFGKVDDFKLSAKEMMKSSRLVIIDYIATSYLESLIMNIPTIVFFDPSRYFLKNEYKSFFDDLIKVGIFQTHPQEAATFINNMGEDIEQWWESNEVQNARKSFLDENIGNPEDAIKFYLSLLEK